MPERMPSPIAERPPPTPAHKANHDMTARLSPIDHDQAPSFSKHGERVEVRFELALTDVQILDGYCQATGTNRSDVFRRLLKEWSDRKLHEAIAGESSKEPA